ncbi:VirB2 family type IV secretion system major pilin TrwL [Bartonella sp. CB60]|uniref:VirB2 family type IV secretion system major pilin TrwL n=1 Tax=Bartonella sp. CB60 TaxID=3113619 RepID=UPI00300E6A21
MKQSNILQRTVKNKIIQLAATVTVFFTFNSFYANAQNTAKTLKTAESALKGLQEELIVIIPLAATVILLCLAIFYAGRYIEKDTFLRWSIGIIIAGSAAQIVTLLFKGTNVAA